MRGLKIGLLLDAGAGLPTDPEIRAAVQAAAERFEAAGAQVQTIAPFFTRAMLDGMDAFWRMRSWLDYSALPPRAPGQGAALHRRLAEGRRGAQRRAGLSRLQPDGRDARSRRRRAPALRLRALADLAGAGLPAELAAPTDDPMRSLEHIAYTVPYNMSEQPAASINCGWTKAGLPIGLQIAGKRHDDLGVLQVARAWEAMRPAPRAWPEPPVA